MYPRLFQIAYLAAAVIATLGWAWFLANGAEWFFG
jgi:hypothetical protein